MKKHNHYRVKSWHKKQTRPPRASPRVSRQQFFQEENSRTTDEPTSQTARFPHSMSQRGDLLIQGPRDETPRNSQQQETNTGAKQSPELNQQGSPARASNESKKKLKKVSERRSRQDRMKSNDGSKQLSEKQIETSPTLELTPLNKEHLGNNIR